jgi:hypothetical protein
MRAPAPGIAGYAIVAEQGARNCINEFAAEQPGNCMMTSKSQTAWETAAQCATRAAEAADSEERQYYTRMRDAWTTLAKRCEDFTFSDVTEK